MNSNVPISAAPSPSPSGEAAKRLTQAVYEALSPNPNHGVLESWELLDSFLPRSVAERLMQTEKEIRANVGAAGGLNHTPTDIVVYANAYAFLKSYSHIKYPESLECGMSGSTQAKIYLSTLLPIAVTAAVLPQNGMSLYPRLDKLRSIPCDPVSIEKVQNFFTNAGIGSTGIFLAIVLGPVVVRSIFRWQNRRRREREQRLSAPVVMPLGEERKEEEKKSLIYGDNPDYHAGVDLTPTPPSSNTAERQPKRFRHLRIHSLDELPPPTLDDISRQSISWSCPVSPVLESAPTLNKPGKRRSPFNPVVPGMKTTWEEGVDPVTGRRWKRKLVVYTSLETLDKTSDEKMVGELGSQENGSPPRS